jgi:hypothetical protein
MRSDVFISHASEDREAAARVCQMLERGGIACWIAPRDIHPGDSFQDATLKAVVRARAVIVVLSSRTAASPAVLREIEVARGEGIPILPVRIEDAPLRGPLASFIGNVQALDAFRQPLEHYHAALARSVTSLLRERDGSAGAAPSAPSPYADAGPAPSAPPPAARRVDRLGLARALLIGVGLFFALALGGYLAKEHLGVRSSNPPPVGPSTTR